MSEAAVEIGRAVYSVGLLILGAWVIASAPSAMRVLRDLTAALVATASGLRAVVADKETLDQLRLAVERVELAQAVDRKTLAEIKTGVERLTGAKINGVASRPE